jgi:hypothetical protein
LEQGSTCQATNSTLLLQQLLHLHLLLLLLLLLLQSTRFIQCLHAVLWSDVLRT